MPYWICAIVLAVVSFLVATVLEALSLSTDSQIEAHDWYSTSGFNGAAWASCILAAALSAGLWLIPQFCWDAWALWCLLGGTAAFIVYMIWFMLDFETDRTREMWAFGGLMLALYLSGLPTVSNLTSLDPAGWGWLTWGWTLAILVAIVIVAVRAQSTLYDEESEEARAAADPERAPSKGGAALAVILIAVVAFVATQLGNVAYAAVAQPAAPAPIEQEASTETEENETAAESSNGMSEEATYFQDLAKRLNTWMDLEDLQGEKAFWMTDNSMNVGLDSEAFKANTLDVQVPQKVQVGLMLAWELDQAFDTHYIRSAHQIFLPGVQMGTTPDQVCDLFIFFAGGEHQAYYNAWYPGPVEFARTLTWKNTTAVVSQQTCVNRYTDLLPIIDVEINGNPTEEEIAEISGVEPSKNKEGKFEIVRKCENGAAEKLGVPPKTHEQMMHPSQQTVTTTTTTTTTTTPPSGGGGETPTPKPVPPNPKPEPEPEYHKEPEKSSNYGPNDNQGPGPNTNNGPGAQTSRDDNAENHTIDSTYPEYQNTQENLRQNNETQQQQQANVNNEPTYTPPETSDGGGNTIESTANNNVSGNVDQAGTNQPPSQAVAGQEDGGAYTPPD